ncbi:hypothetical protein ACFC0K_16020 [Streptomyces hydrogenans]|uniref:hypothetical protein n=1 Tax=Streptomyces hydrogenans TaxID=1873719 RepID=UPI0035DBF535
MPPKPQTGTPAEPATTEPATTEPLLLTDLRPIAADLANHLGEPWTADGPTALARRVLLRGPDGRGLGLALIFAGAVVQMWITGFGLPDLPKTATKQEHAARARRLAPGRSWHLAQPLSCLLTEDTTAADIDVPAALHQRITEDLLPAYENKPPYVARLSWGDDPKPAEEQPTSDTPAADTPRTAPAPARAPLSKKPRRRTT